MIARVAWILTILSVLSTLLPACSPSEVEDVNLVVSKLDMRQLTQGEGAVITFGTGKLSGVGAVLWVERDAAFWVMDGTVYAVNDNAKALGPDLPAPPGEITYQAIYDVVDAKPKR